jgi:hypothetical protein
MHPNKEKMAQLAEQIEVYEPSVDEVIGFMDGLSLSALVKGWHKMRCISVTTVKQW